MSFSLAGNTLCDVRQPHIFEPRCFVLRGADAAILLGAPIRSIKKADLVIKKNNGAAHTLKKVTAGSGALRILVVSHSGKMNGGAENSLFELLQQLRQKENVEITVLFPVMQGPLIEAVKQMGIAWETAKYQWHCYPASDPSFLGNLKVFAKTILDFGTAVVLANKFKGEFNLIYSNTRVVFIGAYLAKILKLPHVWHIREFASGTGLNYGIGYNRRMKAAADRYIATSKALANALPEEIERRKIRVIYNGIPLTQNVPKKQRDSFDLLVCGAIQPSKHQLDAIKALHLLKLEGYDGIRLHIAGSVADGSEAYLMAIETFIRDNGMQNEVVMHGYVKDMPQLFAEIDVELVCSESEGFGRVIVEAMRSGIVVIAPNCGAAPEIINDGEDGFLYEPMSIEDLKAKIVMTLDVNTRNRLSQNALMNTRERYLPQENARQVYETMLEARGSRGTL